MRYIALAVLAVILLVGWFWHPSVIVLPVLAVIAAFSAYAIGRLFSAVIHRLER